MSQTGGNQDLGRVAKVVEEIGQRPLPVVDERAPVCDIVDAFERARYSRIVYVVNGDRRLVGIITLAELTRHVFYLYHDVRVDARELISQAVSEIACDFMHEEPLVASPEERVEDILERMIEHDLKEIPVIDKNGRLVADLTMVDLLDHFGRMGGHG